MIETNWMKPAALGAAAGALAVVVVGFSWGGWTTASTAEAMASDRAHAEVVQALTPVCVASYRADPEGQETLAELKAAQSYARRQIVMDTGWATPPGSSDADRDLASACADRIVEGS